MFHRNLKTAHNSKFKANLSYNSSFAHNSESDGKRFYSVTIKNVETNQSLTPFETSEKEAAENYFNEFTKLNNLRIYS